jgi:adenylate kinase family enzyme
MHSREKRGEFPSLEAFGRRICVCGPSNAGKSTLADSVSRKLNVPVVFLDQLRFAPNTDWEERPDEEFRQLHDAAVAGDEWIMDGNYSSLLPQRFERATGIILLSTDRWSALQRYLVRTLAQSRRIGSLDGGKDSLKWSMVKWILFQQPKRRVAYNKRLYEQGLPIIQLRSMAELNLLYKAWELERL